MARRFPVAAEHVLPALEMIMQRCVYVYAAAWLRIVSGMKSLQLDHNYPELAIWCCSLAG